MATKKTRLKLDIKKLLLIPNNGSHSAGSPENHSDQQHTMKLTGGPGGPGGPCNPGGPRVP